ncbi:MAG: polynucleotide adenylyltransferase PcnB [Methylococcales bacterium]|nr:polynucleotide adenylyltransferase PcnB [Methylococcales bacterium]
MDKVATHASLPSPASTPQPVIYSRSQHPISRSHISENALKVLYRLKSAGHEAYLVGGCVRDLLLGREPKDFDVVTNASPEQVRKIFRNSRLVGRRFRLAHVRFGRDIIEVATFRGQQDTHKQRQLNEEGRLLCDNVYGTLEQDVWRRDFTINALYYNIRDFSLVDHVGGMTDLKAGLLRLIGDPEVRYREDPVRMLRAVRFAVKLGFTFETATEQPLTTLAPLLRDIPPARLFDECLKLFLAGSGVQTFEMLRHYQLFGALFPDAERILATEAEGFPRLFIVKGLENSDRRLTEGKTVTAYFLFAVLLWHVVRQEAEQQEQQGEPAQAAWQNAATRALNRQIRHVALPRRITQAMREVWLLQLRFQHRSGQRPYRLLEHPRFRAAYDFLCLRISTEGVDPKLGQWWETFQQADEAEQRQMINAHTASRRRTGNNPRRRYRNNRTNQNKRSHDV